MKAEGNNKVCSKCRKIKDVSEFHLNKTQVDGLNCQCKDCVREYQKSNKFKNCISRYKEKNRKRNEAIQVEKNKPLVEVLEVVKGYVKFEYLMEKYIDDETIEKDIDGICDDIKIRIKKVRDKHYNTN